MAGGQHERATTAGAGVIRSPSSSHPIRIEQVPIEGVAGHLCLTSAPGKRSPGVVSRVVWDRSLDNALAALRDQYRSVVLVSLIEDHEFELLGIPDLVERAERRGMRVRRFAIRDVSVPEHDEATAFGDVVEHAYGDLTAGRNVTVHCRGGGGRAGLVAAFLVVRHGAWARHTIARVRAAWRGAIETKGQERLFESFAARMRHP